MSFKDFASSAEQLQKAVNACFTPISSIVQASQTPTISDLYKPKDYNLSVKTHNVKRKVLVLGNGFDLDLGRKTSYKDFYESDFCPKNYPAPLIWHLNEKWKDSLDNVKWYDLENEFSNYYYLKIEPNNGPQDIITDNERQLISKIFLISDTLPSYSPIVQDNIVSINGLNHKGCVLHDNVYGRVSLASDDLIHLNAFERDKKAFGLILKGLNDYLNSLVDVKNKNSLAYKIAINFSKQSEDEFKSIYSFNYTDIDILSGMIKYVHGNFKDCNIVLGTKDARLNYGYDFMLKSFHPDFNPPQIVRDLLAADEITFFGHSLGDNDSQYFKTLFSKISSYNDMHDKYITIITKDNESVLSIKKSLQEMTDNGFSRLCSMNKITFICSDNK